MHSFVISNNRLYIAINITTVSSKVDILNSRKDNLGHPVTPKQSIVQDLGSFSARLAERIQNRFPEANTLNDESGNLSGHKSDDDCRYPTSSKGI